MSNISWYKIFPEKESKVQLEYDTELIEYLRLIFGDAIEIQRERRSWIKIPHARIYVNGSKNLQTTDEGFYDLSEGIFKKLVEDQFSYYVLIYNSPEYAFVLPSLRVREIFEGNPFFQIKDSEWGFNIYQKNGKHFLKLKNIKDKEYDIDGYRDKWEQIDYFKNKPRILPSNESLKGESSIWIHDIVRAFRKLGEINSFHPLNALYQSIEEIRKEDNINLPKNYKAIVRYYLETNSRGSGKDLFEPREIGSGYWRVKDNNDFSIKKDQNYWIFVVTDHDKNLTAQQILLTRMNDKFWGLNAGTPSRALLKKDDKVIFSHGAKEFLGTATLDSDSFELNRSIA